MRIVGAPHQGLDAHILDELRADPVELERGAALPAPILARLQLHQIAEAVLEFEIHAVERIGQPADAALAKAHAHVRIALQHTGADDRRDDVDEVHLEAGNAGELRHAADLALLLHADFLRHRWEGVEMQWQLDVVDRCVSLDRRGDSERAVNGLGVDAILLHRLDPEVRVAGTRLAALARVVEAGLGHLVDPVVLARDKLAADRADAAPTPHIHAGLGDPLRPVRPYLDVGHALLYRARRLGDEQFRWQPGQV